MMTRRDLLRTVAGGAAALAVAPSDLLALQEGDAAYGGFKMGLQTYSLRNFDLDQTIAKMKELGLKYAQFYPDRNKKQMELTNDPSKIEAYRQKLSAAGLTIMSFGVVALTKDHEANKSVFEFAKAMGFKTIVADPAPDSFESVSSLAKDYGMKIAIHNHGPKHRYDKLTDVLKAVEKYPEAIGACVDTGHTLRSGENPVDWIRKLGPRVHDVHLKDASAPEVFNVLGQGKLDVVGTLQALKELKFAGILALEYELKPQDPMEDLKACLAATREAAKKLRS